jgi:sRNA-binding protein
MHEGIAQLAELYPDCFRQPRQPLKIGIHNDIMLSTQNFALA